MNRVISIDVHELGCTLTALCAQVQAFAEDGSENLDLIGALVSLLMAAEDAKDLLDAEGFIGEDESFEV